MMEKLVLASASPRRRELLQQIGIAHSVLAVDIDETPLVGETPTDMVCRLAQHKARAAREIISDHLLTVLAADTTIEYNGISLGKPQNENDAVNMLLTLSGNTHQVTTAFCILGHEKQHLEYVTSDVEFCTISEQQARNYWQTGEPQDKAGSYAIQGKGAVFVKQLTGSYSAVVGLPLYECHKALLKFGVYK